MDMPKPGPGHRKLELLAGNWAGEEVMHPSQWDPKGGTAIGRNLNRLALDGFALIMDYSQERGGKITFTGHGVMTYDLKSDTYTLYWVDCMGLGPEVHQGRFTGNVLVIGRGGPGVHTRMTYDLTTPERWIGKMEMSQDGKEWKTMFDGSYSRS